MQFSDLMDERRHSVKFSFGDMIDYTDNVKISEENGKPKINFKENNSETNM